MKYLLHSSIYSILHRFPIIKHYSTTQMQSSDNKSKSNQNDNFIRRPSSTEVTIDMTRLFSYKNIETTFQTLVILDNTIDMHLLEILQAKCQNIILVDGGANRIYASKFKDSKKIRCIIGDFDGIKEQAKTYYHKKGIDVHHDPDQNNTDFQKTMNFCRKMKYDEIVVLNFYPGRIDHVLAGISATQKELKNSPRKHIILIGQNSMMIYLHEKIDYTIHVKSEKIQNKGCGMITFGKVIEIETEGFKWNLSEKQFFKTIEWGNFLSTSNEFVSDKVKISSSDPLFVVAAIKPEIKVETIW